MAVDAIFESVVSMWYRHRNGDRVSWDQLPGLVFLIVLVLFVLAHQPWGDEAQPATHESDDAPGVDPTHTPVNDPWHMTDGKWTYSGR